MNSHSLILKYFPPPHYLLKPAAGLDISDRSVKFIELGWENGLVVLKKYGEETIPPGVVESGKIVDEAKLVQALESLRQRFKLEYVAASLPEEEAYLFSVKLPLMKKSEIYESIRLQLENHIPLPADKAVFDYEIHCHPSNQENEYEIGVAAISSQNAASYENAIKKSGLIPSVLEIEAHSLPRAVMENEEGTIMIIDFGKTRMSVIIVSSNKVKFTATVNSVGGEDITKAVERHLAISRDEAEKLKIEQGLSRGEKNKKPFEAIIPVVSALKDEIYRHFHYWNNHHPSDLVINKIILAGGQATLPGLAEYLSINLNVNVLVANPWINVTGIKKEVPDLPFNESLRYTTAIGLALRGLGI